MGKWHKAPGDEMVEGDVVCDIQTDKAVMAMEASEEGVLAKLLIEENTTVKVNTLIALLAEDGEDWKQVAASGVSAESSAASPAAAAAAEPAAVAASGGSTPGTKVNMPSLSPTMEEGTIVKWHKAEGEAIAAGDVLCDIQTDKAVVSMEADDDGIVAKIIMEEGSGAKVGTLIALLVGEGEDWKDVAIPGSAPPPPRPTSGYTDVELTSMRRVIAKRLTESKQQAPHGYSSATSDITAISRLRQEYIRSGFKVSINDFVIKAAATALQYVP